MALHGISPQLRRNSSQEEERVNGWLGAPEEMDVERREEVEEEGGELVQAVEDQAVLPHHDCGHQSPHTQNIVGLGGVYWYKLRCDGTFVSWYCM